MSAINLFILGIIRDHSQSAYELSQFIKNHNIYRMIKISSPAVYKNLRKLADSGYLDTKKKKEGEMPEKTIYTITEKGESHFSELLTEFSQKQVAFHFDFNAVIISLQSLSKGEAEKYLHKLYNEFLNRRELINKNIELFKNIPIEGRAIIRQFSMLNETLIQWLDDFMQEYLE